MQYAKNKFLADLVPEMGAYLLSQDRNIPERALWLCVIITAIEDVLGPVTQHRRNYEIQEAKYWLTAIDDPEAKITGSLRWIAYQLSDDPEGFIRAVQKGVEKIGRVNIQEWCA